MKKKKKYSTAEAELSYEEENLIIERNKEDEALLKEEAKEARE